MEFKIAVLPGDGIGPEISVQGVNVMTAVCEKFGHKVTLVFPLLAGAGSFTTLLALRAEYATVNILTALVLNMIWVYFVVCMTAKVENALGKGGIYMIRKFFGIILLAISIRLFTANFTQLLETLNQLK